MNDKDAREMAKAMLAQSALIEPGTEMHLVLHTGDTGLHPPSDEEMDRYAKEHPGAEGWVPMGVGGAHAFGPFVSEDEASEWQRLADTIRPCGCRKALVPVIVPRILAVIGPAGMPVEAPGAKDWMN